MSKSWLEAAEFPISTISTHSPTSLFIHHLPLPASLTTCLIPITQTSRCLLGFLFLAFQAGEKEKKTRYNHTTAASLLFCSSKTQADEGGKKKVVVTHNFTDLIAGAILPDLFFSNETYKTKMFWRTF